MTMSVEKCGPIGSPESRTYIAGVANIKRGLALVLGADDVHAVIAGANGVCLGIATEDAPTLSIGDAVDVAVSGETVAQIGAAVAVGNFLKAAANGLLIPVAATGDNVIAQAISSNPASGDWVTVRMVRFIKP
jgi:hypothetical protein